MEADVAIIGAGFSGTMVAAHLAGMGIACVLIEGGGKAGRGTAFSTREPSHVLNVRAEAMSAWPDRPADFVDFADGKVGSRDFARRRLFGQYLDGILQAALQTGLVALIDAGATGAARQDGRWRIALTDGEAILARKLVLAIGNQPPAPLPGAAESGRIIADPWDQEARVAVASAAEEDAPVLIAGTGLTMVDTVLSLDGAGHRGRITAVSRRGLIPRSHVDATPVAVDDNAVPLARVMAVLTYLRDDGAEADWQARVDGLRPHSHRIWQSLDVTERRRFLRHARPWWDVHRHRIAPQVAAKIDDMLASGRLEVVAGKIGEVDAHDSSITLRYRPRGGDAPVSLRADWLFNCTGPLGSIDRTSDPLIAQLLRDGHAHPDELAIGLAVDSGSRVKGTENIWAMGPLAKGRYWEITAVPDIRHQAAAVAAEIARELP